MNINKKRKESYAGGETILNQCRGGAFQGLQLPGHSICLACHYKQDLVSYSPFNCLAPKLQIPLVTALSGGTVSIQHFNKTLPLQLRDVISPGQVRMHSCCSKSTQHPLDLNWQQAMARSGMKAAQQYAFSCSQ